MKLHFIEWINQNCTKCTSFQSNLKMKTDDIFPLMFFSQRITLDCGKHGNIRNDKLFVCDDFIYDGSKEDIVTLEKHHKPHLRYYVRIGTELPPKCHVNPEKPVSLPSQSLSKIITNLTWDVTQKDERGYMMKVCVNRTNLITGISKETIFKEIMKLIESRLLVRDSIEGAVFLRPATSVLSISQVLEIGRRKVLA